MTFAAVTSEAGGESAVGGGALTEAESEALWALAEGAESQPGFALLKSARDGRVFRARWLLQGQELDVVCKQVTGGGLLRRVAVRLGMAREQREFRTARALEAAGVPTAGALACLSRPGEGTCLLVTRYLADAVDLDRLALMVLPRCGGRDGRRIKGAVIERLVELLGRLGAGGFGHRDFKASNVLVTGWDTPGDGPRVWLVDVEGVYRTRRRAAARRALVRLTASLLGQRTVTRTDLVRLVRRWLAALGRGGADWRGEVAALGGEGGGGLAGRARAAQAYRRRSLGRKRGKMDGYGE